MQMLEPVAELVRKLGPYVLVELLLPGGTLFALVLFAYRNPEQVRDYAAKARRAAARAIARLRGAVVRHASRSPSLTMGIETAVRALG
jgi:hypothetical protein